MLVGIVGQGFVGTAVREGLRNTHIVYTYDKKDGDCLGCYESKELSISPFQQFSPFSDYSGLIPIKWLWKNCRVVFLCLPTPMQSDGSCDTSIVESVVGELYASTSDSSIQPIIIIKSTVPPGTTERLLTKYANLRICFNPEFLTEKDSVNDFQNQSRIIIGTDDPEVAATVRQMYDQSFPGVEQRVVNPTVAELVKYFTNIALAVRVSLANEFYQIADDLGINYDQVRDIACLDRRLGDSHWRVPGLENKRGFGGSCFPKDLNGLIAFARSIGIRCPTMQGAWETNLMVRTERDWEQLVGRAVTDR